MELAKYIDHTALKADTSRAAIETLCQEARDYGFMFLTYDTRGGREAAPEKEIYTVAGTHSIFESWVSSVPCKRRQIGRASCRERV